MEFKIYYSYHGKKLKETIEADNEEDARDKLFVLYKVERVVSDPAVDELKKIFGMFD